MYLDIIHEHNYDAMITITPELPGLVSQSSLTIDGRKLRNVTFTALSWSEVRTEALIQQRTHAICQPTQAWVLSEFIRYLEGPQSGAVQFDDMGPSWVTLRRAARMHDLPANSTAVADVWGRFGQLASFIGMHLSQQLGLSTHIVAGQAIRQYGDEQAKAWTQQQITDFAETGRFTVGLVVPKAPGPIMVTFDVHSGCVESSLSIDAPLKHRPLTSIKWLLEQLPETPSGLTVAAKVAYARTDQRRHRFDKVREDLNVLIEEPKETIREFILTLNRPSGTKRGMGSGLFVESVLKVVDDFYFGVVQHLKQGRSTPASVKGGSRAKPNSVTTSTPLSPADLMAELAPGDTGLPRSGVDGRVVIAADSVLAAESILS